MLVPSSNAPSTMPASSTTSEVSFVSPSISAFIVGLSGVVGVSSQAMIEKERSARSASRVTRIFMVLFKLSEC
jgi:hypothetical protein